MTATDRRTRHGKGAAVAVAAFVGFGVVTDLVPNPVFARMVPRTVADYAFLTATSLLAGAYVVQRDRLREAPGDACAVGGALGGFLAFGCPICNHVLLLAFGITGTMTYFDPLRPLIGVLSVILFTGLLVFRRWRYAPSGADA